MRRRQPVRFYVAALAVVVLLLLSAATARLNMPALSVSAWAAAALSPLTRLSTAATAGIQREVTAVRAMQAAGARNQALSRQVAQLKTKVAQLQALTLENNQLKKLLNLKQTATGGANSVAATVVERLPGSWFSVATIDRGRSDGIAPGDVVMSTTGLVGRVIVTTPSTAQVMFLSDPQSAIGVRDITTDQAGVLHGTGSPSQLTLAFFSPNAQANVGDVVATSGLSGQLPGGLLVGKVSRAGPSGNGLVRSSQVTPFADFDHIQVVLVVKRS